MCAKGTRANNALRAPSCRTMRLTDEAYACRESEQTSSIDSSRADSDHKQSARGDSSNDTSGVVVSGLQRREPDVFVDGMCVTPIGVGLRGGILDTTAAEPEVSDDPESLSVIQVCGSDGSRCGEDVRHASESTIGLGVPDDQQASQVVGSSDVHREDDSLDVDTLE